MTQRNYNFNLNRFINGSCIVTIIALLNGLNALSHTTLDQTNQNWTTLNHDEITKNVQLARIDVSDNNITEFDSTVFLNHKSLEFFILSRNQWYNFPENKSFLTSNSLERFECSSCGISTIYSATFSELTKLKELNLSHNHLSIIQSGAFSTLLLLKNVNLDFNKLKTLPNELMKQGGKLSMNHNSDFDFQPNAVLLKSKSLVEFQCNYCGITSVYQETFSELPKIESIQLNNNQILVFNKDVFIKNNNVTTLFLEQNRLTDFPMNIFDVIVNLKSLCIDGNPLTIKAKKAMKNYYVKVKLRNNCTEVDSDKYFENDPKLFEPTKNKGISDAFIASYLVIILVAQAVVIGIVTMYWFKIVLTDKIDEFDYSSNVLNDHDIYNVS